MSPSRQVRPVWRLVLLLTALTLAGSAGGDAVELSTGVGQPDPTGWCALDWLAGCTTGLAILSGSGLVLYPGQVPPSAFELSLKLLPHDSLLFTLESPSATGRITVLLDNSELKTISLPTQGRWWLRLANLPETGILRLEPDPYCEELTIRSVNFPCPPLPAGSGAQGLSEGPHPGGGGWRGARSACMLVHPSLGGGETSGGPGQ